MTDGTVDLLFVYGTLMPDHLRWPMLSPWASAWGPTTVPGELWDTGNGWPAARLVDGPDRVPGWWVRFEPGALDARLADLDAMEGIGDPPDPTLDPYVRVVVTVAGVGAAWAYHATRREPHWRRIDRWEGQAEA